MTLVPLDMIKTDRVLHGTSADVADLAADIKQNGLKRPVLLLDDMTLVDGLRRIEAARLNGYMEIDAVVTSDLTEIHDVLRKAHVDDGMPPGRRIFELHALLKELIHDYHKKLRNAGLWKTKDRPKDTPKLRISDYMQTACNLPYKTYMGRIVILYAAEAAKIPLAVDLMRQVEAGELNISRASYLWELNHQSSENLSPQDQKILLTESMRNLGVIVKALRRLPKAEMKIPVEDLEEATAQLRVYRAEIYTIYRNLGREARSKR